MADQAKIIKDKEDEAGFWTGILQSGGKTAEVQGYNRGQLQGLIKIKVADIGEFKPLPLFSSYKLCR